MFHVFSLAYPPLKLVFYEVPPSRLAGRARNSSKSHGPYMGRVVPSYFLYIPSYLIIFSSYILHNSFISSSYFWDLEKFRSLLLYIMGSGTQKRFRSPPLCRLWDLEKIRAISSMDMKHDSIAGTWTGILVRSTSTLVSLLLFEVSKLFFPSKK